MRHLVLLRHAKSSWSDPALHDRDRPLSRRGERAAPLVGAFLASRGWEPVTALVSPARRALQTWSLVAAPFGPRVSYRIVDALYEADPHAILSVLREAPPEASSVALVGHNPGLEDFAHRLAAETSDPASRSAMREKFPTGALARFEIGTPWRMVGFGSGRLTAFVRPRDLA